MNRGRKISILGTGNVGATIAYTLTMHGTCSEMVLVDINREKAEGEAMDIIQGTALCPPVNIYSGDYKDTKDSDIIIVTSGMPRKPGQTRMDLTQANVNILKEMMPQVASYSPDAIYIVVSNPVDIATYVTIKTTGADPSRVIGTGTLLDSSRLRSMLAQLTDVSPQSIHAYVFGEHGDTSMIPWSLVSIAGYPIREYCKFMGKTDVEEELKKIEIDVRESGAQVIKRKGATFYAIGLAVARICDGIARNTKSILATSSLIEGSYGIKDVCFSLPSVLGENGISRVIAPPLTEKEEKCLYASRDALQDVLKSLKF